jgi:branched-chain amino acid transport system ATP-binding protein
VRKKLIIEVRNIDVFYGNIRALKKVSLTVDKGEIVALIGGNGAGKSTLMKAIVGLVRKKSGTILFQGKSITSKAVAEIIRLGLGVVPEGRRLFGPLSVIDNLRLGAYLRVTNRERRQVQRDLQGVFRLFPVLKKRSNQSAGTLSGGEQQMLAIARALMGRPKAILMDEPSTGLAPIIVREIFQVIHRLKSEGNTILLIEQNASMALRTSDRAYVLESGQISLEGTAKALLEDDSVRKAYLGV